MVPGSEPMLRKIFSRPVRFSRLLAAIAICHFGVFAVCYFFYRRSYFLAPTPFQSACGFMALILAYPLHVMGWIPFEPNKLLFVVASIANSIVYAVAIALCMRMLCLFLRKKG